MDIFEPKFHKAWNEALIKEKKIRVKWHEQYGSKIGESTEGLEVEDTQDSEPLCTCKDKEKWRTQDHEPTCTCKGKEKWRKISEKQFDWPRKGATGTCTLIRIADYPSEMRIPLPIVKSKLYEGISHDGKGRAQYLKTRWKEDPEDKFYNRVCNSWNYGWNHGKDNEFSCKDPDHCRIRERAFHEP